MVKVIVLEDEPAARRELALLTPWEELGLVFSGEAADGNEGLALAERIVPDIVVTDIRMPGLDGIGFVKEWDSRCEASGRPACECVILSGFSEFEYARSAMSLGITEYLLKPVDDADLRNSLLRSRDRVLGRSRRARSERVLFEEYGKDAPDGADDRVSRAVKIISDRYVSGLTIEGVAAELGVSAGHLSRVFRHETGYTFGDYLMFVRVKRAAELLRDPNVLVYEVADLVGYADARYFGQVFRKITGLTPTEFRNGN